MTLWVYSSVIYIVCVLDSEGQRMGLGRLLIVEQFCFIYVLKRWPGCALKSLTKQWVKKPAHSWWQKCRKLDCSHGCASVSSFAGGHQRGGAPPRQTLQNAPLSFTSQPNLNLTMEPAQYACNPIQGPWQCRPVRIFAFGTKKDDSVCERIAYEWVWVDVQCATGWAAPRFTQKDRTWKKITSSLSFIIVAPPVSVPSTWPWNRMTQLSELTRWPWSETCPDDYTAGNLCAVRPAFIALPYSIQQTLLHEGLSKLLRSGLYYPIKGGNIMGYGLPPIQQ